MNKLKGIEDFAKTRYKGIQERLILKYKIN